MLKNRTKRYSFESTRPFNISLWILQILLGLMFIFSGATKIIGSPEVVELFDSIGWGQWFRYLTGILEIGGAILLWIPSVAFAGAILLSAIMIGAILTHLIIGGNVILPVILLLLTAIIAYGRR